MRRTGKYQRYRRYPRERWKRQRYVIRRHQVKRKTSNNALGAALGCFTSLVICIGIIAGISHGIRYLGEKEAEKDAKAFDNTLGAYVYSNEQPPYSRRYPPIYKSIIPSVVGIVPGVGPILTAISHKLLMNKEMIHLINNPHARNPTWQELVAFIENDETDRKPYEVDDFMCGSYAEEVHNNAEKHGVRAAWVCTGAFGHAWNAFQTTDKGLVYIDCTKMDRVVFVEPGNNRYCAIPLGSGRSYTHNQCSEYSTYRKLEIYW
ncbi:MAG: hypothetical protein FJ008_01935 [Chloroflexi bacterium]|nr:hypothetical protein [Chloroflexota bacterium]MBM3154075.1 hypothetical protein [Chloroflexota bacterium]MBM3173628.1 hypothetical protein [Chloroflexota bacterium]MBM3175349.1 hypothetical protein [Chloroflexota bacterium]